MKKTPKRNTVTREHSRLFTKVRPQMEGLCSEVRELSKKKPDGLINKFKLKIINEKIEAANTLLQGEFKPFKDFDLFQDDNLPSNSDVVVILAQYVKSLDVWRGEHTYDGDDYSRYWKISDGDDVKVGGSSDDDEE